MVTYMIMPRLRVTLDGTVTDGCINCKIEMQENNYWTAQLNFVNTPVLYPTVTMGSTVLIEVQDHTVGGAWTTMFVGTVLYPDYSFSGDSAVIGFQCVSLGYALNMMNVAEEYGLQSRNAAIDTIVWVINNANYGILTRWINSYKGTTQASGYTIYDACENIAGTINYISFPYKPANKCIDDLCDLLTAINGTGPHWIVDHLGNLRIRTIGTSQGGWTKYYGDSQAAATLTNGVDFLDGDFQPMGKEANTIFYYGAWCKPSNGDAWTEGNHADWGTDAGGITYSDETTIKIVGAKSIRCNNSGFTGCGFTYTFPTTIDLTYFTANNTPEVMFDLATGGPMSAASGAGIYNNFFIRFFDSTGDYIYINPGNDFITDGSSAGNINFRRFNATVGYFTKDKWIKFGTPEWSDIVSVEIWCPQVGNAYLDGFHFGNAATLRVARQEFPDEISAGRGTLGTTANPIKFKVITDNIGKDDTLTSGTPGTTDTGLMAQLAKSELLRLSKATENGKFTTPLIADVLPGQYFYIGKDYRITKVTHNLSSAGVSSSFEVTDDVTNSHTRPRYEDINKQYAAIRPEYQDRQASSLKSGSIDIRVAPLEEAYNI
jgi:hypothetical protein